MVRNRLPQISNPNFEIPNNSRVPALRVIQTHKLERPCNTIGSIVLEHLLFGIRIVWKLVLGIWDFASEAKYSGAELLTQQHYGAPGIGDVVFGWIDHDRFARSGEIFAGRQARVDYPVPPFPICQMR